MDLRLGWDLSLRADQVEAEKKLSDEKPHLLILSPTCSSLSTSTDELAELREQANVIWSLHAVWQESWNVDAFSLSIPWRRRRSRACGTDGMRCVRCDQCQFGMTSFDSEGNVGPACKATGFMRNDEHIAAAVDRHCFGGHDHIQLLSGRAKSCEKYPPRLVAAILRALRQSMRAAGRGEAQKRMGRDRQLTIAAVEARPTLEEPELVSFPDDADGNQEFRDRSTGLPLNPEMVKKARSLELQYVEELKVLEDSDRDACLAETGRSPIPTGCVDINKGDSFRPNNRSRLVCQETRGRSMGSVVCCDTCI